MRNVFNKYNGVLMLQDISLSIKKGAFCVLFGPDDSGKTTLLHLLMGFQLPSRGRLSLMGCRPNRIDGTKRQLVRFVPDDLIWEKKLTGSSYLGYAREASLRYSVEREQQLCRLFEIPLEEEVAKLPQETNKLIQLIAAFSACPELLILDEPDNFLSVEKWKLLLQCLEAYHREGMTILLSVEQYEAVGTLGDYYVYLKEGKVQATGAVLPDKKHVKRITVSDGEKEKAYTFNGDVTKVRDILVYAGYDDWTIENLTLQEELEMENKNEK